MVNELPDGWQYMELEKAVDAILDYRGKSPTKTTSGVPLVTAKIVKDGRINEATEFIATDDYNSWMRRGLPKIGDVLLTTEAPLGQVAQVRDARIALAQRLIALRGKDDTLDNTFFKFLLQSDAVQNELLSRSTGTTVVGIKQRELRKIALHLPPIDEQRKIGDILGVLDDKIELNRQMNRTLEAVVRAIFKAWFVDFDPVKAKAVGATSFRGMPQAVFEQLPDRFTDTELGAVPNGWGVASLSNLVELIGGGTPKRGASEYWHGDIPWFSVKDAPNEADVWVIDTEEKITTAGLEHSSAKVMRAGTSIISARGTVGRLALAAIPMSMNQSCYGVTGKEGIGDYFVYFTLHDAVVELQKRSHGSVFDTITRRTFDGLKRVLPQPEVLAAFEEVVSPYMMKMRGNLFESKLLADIRNTLLPKLISGDLRVPRAKGEGNEK